MIDTWEKVLDPNFINAELIGDVGAERVVTIKDIDFKEMFDQRSNSKIKKQSLFFEECKPMVLNKTNTKTLIKLFAKYGGPQACIGKKIVLYVDITKAGGKPTTGIRIKEYTETRCEDCGKLVKPTALKSVSEWIEYSKAHTGRILCLECMRKEKERQEQRASAEGQQS